ERIKNEMNKIETIELLMSNIESITNNYDNPIGSYYRERRIAFYGGTYLVFDAEYMSNEDWVEDRYDNQHPYLENIKKGIIDYCDEMYNLTKQNNLDTKE